MELFFVQECSEAKCTKKRRSMQRQGDRLVMRRQ